MCARLATAMSSCKVGNKGVLLPLFGDDEQRLPPSLRALLYMMGLLWCFMGVAIIADIFMGAIERITSKKIRRVDALTGRVCTVYVWNATVANLTLMALGSSAPEILLGAVELIGNGFESGELGPSTIVGSAAFNLLCITAVCMVSIPAGETRKIKGVPVYAVTSSFSVLAYVWILVVLQGLSPDEITVVEACITLAFFPLLAMLAFAADKGYLSTHETDEIIPVGKEMSKDELARLEAEIRRIHGAGGLTNDQISTFVRYSAPVSRAKYRIAATRSMTGGKRVHVPQLAERPFADLPKKKISSVAPCDLQVSNDAHCGNDGSPNFTFQYPKCAVLENAKKVEIMVCRQGDASLPSAVKYATREGNAKEGNNFLAAAGELRFNSGETKKPICVSIVDNQVAEEDMTFYVDLLQLSEGADLGHNPTMTVVIIDDDAPGEIEFLHDAMEISEGMIDLEVDVVVLRKGGCSGVVGCKVRTEDDTAVAGKDYNRIDGVLEFQDGQSSAILKIVIKAAGRYESKEMFRVILEEAYGSATFGKLSDGGANSCILSVFIHPEGTAQNRIDNLYGALTMNWDKFAVGEENWREQFRNAIRVHGDDDEDHNEDHDGGDDLRKVPSPSYIDMVMHFLLLPWKLLFAIVPPTDFCGGWLCFFCALIMIGGITVVIGDLASLLGCVMTIPDPITAITFVALGTSLPDTFASRTAAIRDPYADASIGNITGSNSVNVFLGLGVPWVIGSLYWTAQGKTFKVPAGSLSFSVAVFTPCATACLAVLLIRRKLGGYELGGDAKTKYATAILLVGLWLLYVALSSWKAMDEEN